MGNRGVVMELPAIHSLVWITAIHLLAFFFFNLFYWSIVDLQCCVHLLSFWPWPPAESPLHGAGGNVVKKRESGSLNSLHCSQWANWATEVKGKEEKCPEAGLRKQAERGPSSGIEKEIPNTRVSSSHQSPLVKVKEKQRWRWWGRGVEGKTEIFREMVFLKWVISPGIQLPFPVKEAQPPCPPNTHTLIWRP